ncbi:MAG: hypothetical protein WB816_11005 [Methylocystis sp.]
MSIRFGALLLALPMMISNAHAAPTRSDDARGQPPVVTAPAAEQAAMPGGCAGCAGHDCANCPLLHAAAAIPGAPPAKTDAPCK